MTAKRYFKRMWEEEFYIFDSEIISENEFDEKVEYEDYQAFADSMLGEEVVNKLNQLYDENKQLKQQIKDLYKFVKYDVDNEINVYPKIILEYLVNILKIMGDVE